MYSSNPPKNVLYNTLQPGMIQGPTPSSEAEACTHLGKCSKHFSKLQQLFDTSKLFTGLTPRKCSLVESPLLLVSLQIQPGWYVRLVRLNLYSFIFIKMCQGCQSFA